MNERLDYLVLQCAITSTIYISMRSSFHWRTGIASLGYFHSHRNTHDNYDDKTITQNNHTISSAIFKSIISPFCGIVDEPQLPRDV